LQLLQRLWLLVSVSSSCGGDFVKVSALLWQHSARVECPFNIFCSFVSGGLPIGKLLFLLGGAYGIEST